MNWGVLLLEALLAGVAAFVTVFFRGLMAHYVPEDYGL
ncbi:Uncharacterised protein [Serratia fonticola]|nr:Uncharacterised protein [Serratia fonticola]